MKLVVVMAMLVAAAIQREAPAEPIREDPYSSKMLRESYEDVLHRCPNGKAIAALQAQFREATSMADRAHFKLAKALSIEAYRCAVQMSDPAYKKVPSPFSLAFERDVAEFDSINYLYHSIESNAEAVEVLPTVADRADALARSTSSAEVQTNAMNIRDVANTLLKSFGELGRVFSLPSPLPPP